MNEERSPAKQGPETQNIREMLASKQHELDTVLAGVSEEVDMWNLVLEEASRSADADKGRALGGIAQEAISSLDGKWPFHGDYIHVSGKWYEPEFSLEDTSMSFPMHEADAFSIVQSNGFGVLEKQNSTPTVGLSFMFADLPLMSAAIQGHLSLLTYADPKEVSLYYIRPRETPARLSDIEQFSQKLHYYDQLVQLHYHSEDSEFYRKSAKKQKKFLTEVIDTVSDTLPAPEFGEPAECNQIEAPYVYRRITKASGSEWERISSSDQQPILLAGKIDGIGILESNMLEQNIPLRSSLQLIDPEAGLCLVLRVEQCSIPDTFNNQPVYVPLQTATEINISLP